jgi:hypothetical protein
MLNTALLALVRLRRAIALPLACLLCVSFAASASAQTTVSASEVSFPPGPVGTTSAAQGLTLTNTQAVPLNISSIAVTNSSFAISGTTCPIAPVALAAGASCTVQMTFTPNEGGLIGGLLNIVDDAGNSPTSVLLFGFATSGGPTSISTLSLGFGNVAVGQTSAPQTFSFTNNTSASIGVSSVTAPAGFAISNNGCPTTLGPGASCNISVTMTPPGLYGFAGGVFITDSVDANPVELYVYGIGVVPVTASPSAIFFGSIPASTQTVQYVTVTNNQTQPVTFSSIAASGTGYSVVAGSTTCPAAPAQLAGGASCVIAVGATPPGTATYSGALSIGFNASNSPITVALSATGVPISLVSPASINFGDVAIGAASAVQTVTVQNTLSTTLTLGSLSLPAGSPFAVLPSSTCLGASLAPGASCTVNLTVTPSTTGGLYAALSINDNAPTSPQTVQLFANGIIPAQLSQSSLAFGSIPINVTSPAQTITLSNNQASPLAISSVNVTGPFALVASASTCPLPSGSLPGGAGCVYTLTFDPTATGSATGQISVSDNAANTPQTASLSGTGTLATAVSPSSLVFGTVVIGATSPTQSFTLSNLQLVPLNISSIAVPAPYVLVPGSTTCSSTIPLAAHSSCTVGVALSPTMSGPVPASVVSITDDAVTSPQNVTLTGAGIPAVTLTPNPLNFGVVTPGVASTLTATLTNNQTVPLSISSAAASGSGYSISSTTCGSTLGSGLSCNYVVSFTAPSAGSFSGSLNISDNASSSPQSIVLSANAGSTSVSLSPSTLTFAAQLEGVLSPGQGVTLTNLQSVPLTIASMTLTGANPGDFSVGTSCPTTPAMVPASGACSITVYFKPTAPGTRTATLNVNDNASGSPQTVSLTGSGSTPLTISPVSALTYTAPVGNTGSSYVQFTITNTNAGAPVHISSLQTTGDFTVTQTNCPVAPAALAMSASCVATVNFAPTIAGTRGGQFLIYDDTVTSPQVVNLQGVGTSPLTVSTNSLIFQATKLSTVSAGISVVLTNHEVQSETFALGVTGPFSAVSNCPTGIIASLSSCVIVTNFEPTASGPNSGNLSITHSAANGSPISVSLSGSGITTNPPGAVSSVSPGAGSLGTVVNVTITGNTFTNFSASSVVNFYTQGTQNACAGLSVSIPTPAATTANTIAAQLTIASNAVPTGCDISVVTGSETDFLSNAFIIADPTNSHVITSAAPNFGIQGQNLNVDLTATGTSFQQGVTFANFGDGISVNNLIITSATTAQANISITNVTYVGPRTITLVTGGEVAVSAPGAFQVNANSAALVSVTPNSASQGASLGVSIVATGTHFQQDATQVSFTGGINVGEVQVTSPTTAVAQIAVAPGATVGLQNMTVSTGGEIAMLGNAFTVTGSTPYLSSITPSSGQQGQTLNLQFTGVYTSFAAGQVTVNIGGDVLVNSYNVTSATSMSANISVSLNAAVAPRTGYLTVGPAGSQTIFPFSFTVTPSSAQIVSVTPSSVPQGGQVTLTVVGANTHWVQGSTVAAFPPTPSSNISVNEVTIIDSTHATLNISVSTDTAVGGYGFYMATGGEVVSSSISVYANTPTLTMSPANGIQGTSFSVSFTGAFTHFGATTLPVISGYGVTLTNFTVNSLVSATGTLTIANNAPYGLYQVTFTTGGEIVTTNFNVTNNGAYLYSISPYQSVQNNTLNVEIVGVNTHFAAGTTVVLFDPSITVNSTTINNATDLVANITVASNAFPGYHTAYVSTGAEQVIIGFLVVGPTSPSIVGVTPSSGAQGSTENVTITGALTNWQPGVTEAILGAGVTVSNFTVTSPTSATATISVSPTAPVGGNSVVMITGSEIESGAGFSVTPNSATISIIQPACANPTYNSVAGVPACTPASGAPVVSQLQTVTLAVTGVGTHWLQGETTASFGPNVSTDSITVISQTLAVVQITVLSSAPVGLTPLTFTTDGEVVTLQQAIDVEEGYPVLLSTAPGGGLQGATLNLQLLGRFTHWVSGVTSAAFNQDITVNSINVIDNENAIANITVSPLAYVDYYCSPSGHTVTVTTGSEQVSLLGTFCVGQGPAQVTTVSPAVGPQGTTQTITVNGSSTHWVQGLTTANFGPGINVGNVNVTSPTTATVSIAITTSAPVGYTFVTMTTLGEVATQQYAFQVSPNVATLVEAIPNQAEQGAPLAGQPTLNIHLIGQYSHFSAQSTATFGAGITINSVTYTDATDLTVNITVDPLSFTGGRTVTVTTPGVACGPITVLCAPGATTGSEIVSNNVFTVIPGPAIITSVAPATGNQGQEVVFNITGSNSHWAQNITQFYIPGGGSDLTINAVVINSATSATVDMTISPTAGLGSRSIYMVTAGESLVDSGAFVITGGIPVITYLSPNNAQPGTTGLNVTIHGLYTNWDNTTTVNFGSNITVTQFQVENSTTINAVISIDANAPNGYRTVFVQTGTQALASNFQVYTPPPPVPYISYFVPSSALPGQTLSVNFTGANTHWDPAATTAEFGNNITVNTFQVLSPTSATANITIAANAPGSSNQITITTGSEVVTAGFNIVVSVPTLSIVDPSSGLQGSNNLNVNIIGQYTVFDSTTTFNFGSGITVNSVTIIGPTVASANISIAQLAQLGGRSVTATTEGVTIGGAGYTVTPSLALISAISPNTAQQGASVNVDVTGQNTHWSAATVFSFGDGITVSNVVVNSSTDATMTLTIPPLAGEGATGATATTSGEVARINNAFVVQPGTPYLLSSGPGSVPQQGSVTFTILSQATTWTTTPPTVSYGAGIVISNVNVTGDTSLTVMGYAQPTTPVGYRNLTVTAGSQVLSIGNAVYVSPGPAVINSVSPATAGQGANIATLQINGINTNWQQGVTTLSFPGALVNSLTINSPTSATANITVSNYATPGFVSITMTTLGEVASESNAFEITQTQPEILYINPASVVQGATQTVTITTLYTNFVQGTTTATFGAGITVNSVTVASATSLQVNLTVQPTAALGYRNVSLTTGSQNVAVSNLFQVAQGPAAIYTLSPNTGQQNQSLNVLITGSQTNFAQGTTVASFGGGITVTGLTVTDLLHATASITIPNSTAAGNYTVTLTTGGEVASILQGFSVTSGNAVIATVNPPTGHQGATLNVALTGQFTAWVNTTSVANFGAGITVNSLTVSDATDAVANITISPTATIGNRNVTVTTGSQVASITGGFSVLAGQASLSSAMPGNGAAGTTENVVITGAFSSFSQATSVVSFGSGITVNFITVANSTQLTANITIAANAAVGNRDVNVTTGSENLTLTNGFMVTPGTPSITVINPNIGTPNATVSVTITGQYTNWINGTTVANFGPGISVGGAAEGANGPVTVSGTGALTASLQIDPAAALGPRTVVVTTNSEVDTVGGGFTVEATTISAPTIISLSPGAYAGGMPTNSNIIAVFSQPMNRTTLNTSSVLLYLTSNQGQGYIPVAGTVTVDATGRVVTFTPTTLLAVNSTFQFEVTNAVQDASGNTFNYYDVNLNTAFTATSTNPTVIAANPVVNSTIVGTNALIQLEFSTDMNQNTQAGLTVSTGGNPVAGSYSWNASPNCCSYGPGTILTFTPAAPLSPTTTYTVAYTSTLTDTAGNTLVPGSFNFTTAAAADTTNNSTFVDFTSFQANVGTNFAPTMNYAKPIDPIDINTGTLGLYNYDSGKYIPGTVTVAANGLSAVYTPLVPLLPNTAYEFYQNGGYYDMDSVQGGVYLYGATYYFITGAGSNTSMPTVSAVAPANTATAVPLNANVVLHLSEPVNPATVTNGQLTVTPSGGSAINGTATLASDQVTLTFSPAATLVPNTVYTVQLTGFQDLVGNVGLTFTSTFTTANSVTPLNVSTGFTSGGTLSTVTGTPDANWTVAVGSNPPVPAEVDGNNATDFYPSYLPNGPKSSWIALNPNSTSGNSAWPYSTTFNLTGYSLTNLCLVGGVAVNDNGTLYLNGTAITGNLNSYSSLASLNVALPPAQLNAGLNTLTLEWGSNDNYYEAFRLQASIQTCGSSEAGGLSVVSTSPAINATNVSTAATITMNFNNPLDPSTVSDTTLPVMVGWNSNDIIAGTWVVNGAQAVFTPAAPFPPNTQIYVGECNGPYDLAGDALSSSCYQYQLLYFTTSSTVTAPSAPFQVKAFSPGSGATGVGLRAPVAATFNRSFNPNTINTSSATQDFNLYNGDSSFCSNYNRSSDNTTLQFNCYALPSSAQMTALINSNLQDMAGNGVANFTSSFTTAPYDSNTHGSIITTRPTNGAGSIAVNSPLVFFTNLPVNASTVNAGIQVAQNNVALPGTLQVQDNGYTVVFTPSAPLTPGALIQWWVNGSLMDTQYNVSFNGTNGYFYVVANAATATPSVTAASPALYSSSIPNNAIFDFQFNTPLNPSTVNSTTIYLYDSGTGLNVPATYSMPQPNEVRIVPSADVSTNHYVYLYFTAGLQSSTSVPATAGEQAYFYTGAADDTSLPTIVSAVPYNGAGNIGVNITPGFVVSKAIDPVSINSSTFQITKAGTPLAGTYYINNTDTRISFVPNDPLPASTSLQMVLNGVLDVEGHPLSYSSNFQTGPGPDFQTPTVVATSIPQNGSVPTNATLTVQFSESMDLTTFNSSNLHIYDYTLNQVIPATISWSADQSVAYLTPTSLLGAGRQFNLYIVSGTDLAGNTLNGDSFTFYTSLSSASSAPTVVAVNPINGSTGLGLNAVIEAQFSAAIDPNTVTGVTLTGGGSTVVTTPSFSAGNTVLQLVPAAPLAPATTYTFTIAGVKDPAGNALATFTSHFSTGSTIDVTNATAVNSNPPGNATVGTNVIPKLIFNKQLNPITVSNSTFRLYLNQSGQFIPSTVTLSASGLEVTIQPQIPLLPGVEYYFQACCGFQDMDGNSGNGVNVYFYTAATGADTSAPTVTINPLNGAAGIPLNAQVNVAVNKPVDPTSWTASSVQLLDNLSNPVAGTLTLPSPQTFVFAPSSPLNPGVTYTVQVSGFTDAMGNSVAPVSSTFSTGSASSTSGLTLTSTNIPFGSTNVSASQAIVLTFSQILDPNTVNNSTLKVMNTWNSNYPLAANYAVSGNQVTITPVSPWPAGASIYVGECGGPTDVLGDVFQNGNCYVQQLVYFVVTTGTPDTSALQVLSVSPANGATAVGTNVPVSVTFNKSINPYSVNSNNAILFAGQSIQDRGSLNLSADGRTITFNIGALYAFTSYTVSLPAGGISDPSGNTLANEFNSTFTTIAYPATGNGSVVATSPGNNATGVPQNSLLTLYLNRPVNASTLNGNFVVTVNGVVDAGTASATASNAEVQFTPSVPFPYGAIVQWSFSGVSDVYGDTYNGNSGTFYIQAAPSNTGAPQQIAVSPACCGTQGLPTNTEMSIQYSLPIDATTLAAGVSFSGGAATISLASPTVVRIVPSAPLTGGSTFYYVCTNSSLKGTDGTSVQTSCYTTYFYTGATGADTTTGTVTVGPPSGAVNVGTNAYIRLSFSKPADPTSINASTVAVTSGGNPIPGTFSYVYTNNNVTGANFSPVNPLPTSTVVQIAVNGVIDLVGNTFTPVTQHFTTGPAPVLGGPSVSYDFGYNTQNIGTNAIFTCRYTAPMDPSSFTPSNVYVYDYATSSNIPVTYTFSADMMSVTLTPTTALTPNTEYNYECYNAIDLTGNAQQNNGGPYFYTGGGAVTTGPQLLYANPPNGVTNVALNNNNGPWNSTSLMLLFNEPLAENSLANITLTPQGGTPLAIGTALDIGDTAVIVSLPSALAPNTTYTYNISGVTDYNGNPGTAATSTFTTGSSLDFNNPGVSAFVPSNGATGVATNTPLTITFSEPMDPVLFDSSHVLLLSHNTQTVVPTTFTFSPDFTSVILTPTSPLSSSTIYDLKVNIVNWYLTDFAGNNLNVGSAVSTFTTGP